MDQKQQVPLLTCPICGRHILSNDANATIAAAPVSCPSCGAVMARATSGQVPVDEAVTHRLQEDPRPNSAFTEAPTAILEPPAEAASPGATPALSPLPVAPTASLEEADQYRTASVSESNPAMPASTTSGDPRTQSLAAAAPVSGAGTDEHIDGRRTLWLAIAMIMVLLVLFVAGIVLSQNGNQSIAPHATPAPLPTSTATAALPAGYLRVYDANGLYSFAVPPSWTEISQPPSTAEYTIYTDPAHDVVFEVESFPTGTQQGAAIDSAVLTLNFSSLKASDISAPVDVTLAGSTWVKESANVPPKPNGIPQTETVVVLTTTLNDHTFIIFYYNPTSGASSSGAQALPQILNTFTFLG